MGGCIMLSAFHDHPEKFSKGILSAPMLGFKNEHFLRTASSLMNIFKKETDYLLGSKPNMGKETPFDKNDLTTDKIRYQRNIDLVRKCPDIRLWGVTNAFARVFSTGKANNPVINNINDKVVYSNHINKMEKRLLNSKMINFDSTEHEVFMEKDIHRERLWKEIEKFM